MLLTRRASYGLLAVHHLAEHPGEGSFSDLAEFYGLPHGALAKILQRLAAAGVLISHRGIKAGFDVLKASEGPRRSGMQRERGWHLKPFTGYRGLCQVSQVVEDMLCDLKIEDIEGKVSSPPGFSPEASWVRAWQLDDRTAGSC